MAADPGIMLSSLTIVSPISLLIISSTESRVQALPSGQWSK
jgi:hypothetical protein